MRGRYLYWSFFCADHCIKQIDSMLPWVCSVIDYRGRQNVVKTSVTHAHLPAARVPLLLFYHILTSSVIYYWTDAQQHGIYLLNMYTSLWVYHDTGGHFQWNLPDRCMWSFQRYLPNKLHLDGNHDYRRCIYQRLNKPGEKENNGPRLIKRTSNITPEEWPDDQKKRRIVLDRYTKHC